MMSLFGWKELALSMMILCFILQIIIYKKLKVHQSSASVAVNTLNTQYVGHDQPERNLTRLWSYLNGLLGNDTLYPESLDVPFVLEHLRTARITNASIFKTDSSLKWMLHLEGGARAIFKPQLLSKHIRVRRCLFGCEHPEFEVVGFAINRMLNLRNMPFTTGRIISWMDEIVPVADDSLINSVNTIKGNHTVCCTYNCSISVLTTRCFPRGQIVGAIIYFLPFPIKWYSKHPHWWKNSNSMKGFECGHVRTSIYTEDRHFADATDFAVADYLMSNVDTQHFFITGNDGIPKMNVVLDAGRAFCPAAKFTSAILTPIQQCCKIRKRVYESLVEHKEDFVEKFVSLTKDDPFFPTLSDKILATFQPRVKEILALVDLCTATTNRSTVLMDL